MNIAKKYLGCFYVRPSFRTLISAAAAGALTCSAALADVPEGRSVLDTSEVADAKTHFAQPKASDGQTVTPIATRQWLLAGGDSAPSLLSVVDQGQDHAAALPNPMTDGRRNHTATVLPSGAVLIFGGVSPAGRVLDTAEIFDPYTHTSTYLGSVGLLPRAGHATAVLTNGEVLIVGGTGAAGKAELMSELFDPVTMQAKRLAIDLRHPHTAAQATLLPDKTVLVSGSDSSDDEIANEIFSSTHEVFTLVRAFMANRQLKKLISNDAPAIAGTNPEDRAENVSLDKTIQIRFTKKMDFRTLDAHSVSLLGPSGPISARVVTVDDGMMTYISPSERLASGTEYTLTVAGVADGVGLRLPFTSIKFKTLSTAANDNPAGASRVSLSSRSTGVLLSDRSLVTHMQWMSYHFYAWRGRGTFFGGLIHEVSGSNSGNNLYTAEGCADDDDDVACTPPSGTNSVLKVAQPKPTLRVVNSKAGAQCFDGDGDGDCEVPGPGGDDGGSPAPPTNAPTNGPVPDGCKSCDPVDVFTGMFVEEKTDLVIPDTIPLTIKRSYRPADPAIRGFGVGTNLSYDMFLVGDPGLAYMDLVLPDGSKVHFTPDNAIGAPVSFKTSGTPKSYSGARILTFSDSSSWFLFLKDGTELEFLGGNSTNPRSSALIAIVDRYGNALAMTRDVNYNLTSVASPNGRSITFSYSNNKIVTATDNIGRSISYGYDSSNHLTTVTDAAGNSESYTYDAAGNMLTETDKLSHTVVTNVYDTQGRISQQTFTDGTTNLFSYAIDGNGHAVTSVTDQRGTLIRTTFNSNGYPLSSTWAYGTALAQTTSYVRDATTNRVTSQTDALGRTTSYQYDAAGNVLSTTRPDGSIITAQYESTYNKPTQITDANGNTTHFTYGAFGNLIQITDPLNHSSNLSYDATGRPTQITDPLGHATKMDYFGGDLARVTDALGRPVVLQRDDVGRLIGTLDPQLNATSSVLDARDRVTQQTDANGNTVKFSYDADDNLSSHTDANGNTTTYLYDSSNRVSTKVDPLLHINSYSYDAAGQLHQRIDAKGQGWGWTFDALGRLVQKGYGASLVQPTSFTSTIALSYDAGNRLTQAVDSTSGTISRSYDTLNRLTQEATPQGTVAYTYDAGGRRTSMTVQGQPKVSYFWDAANRLTQIQQAAGASNGNQSQLTTFAYDDAGRRTSETFPNGMQKSYTYDDANELTALTFTRSNGTSMGNLSYTYDSAGRRTSVGGSLANTVLPAAQSSTTFNADNELVQSDGYSYAYDPNGNLTSMLSTSMTGTTSAFTWNARDQLTAEALGATDTYTYDAMGRRQSVAASTSPLAASITTSYLYDGVNPVQEKIGSSVTANLITGLGTDEYIARSDSAGARYFMTDAINSTAALSDGTAAIRTQYGYDPYGTTSVSGDASSSSYQFTGREKGNSRLLYYRNRYYLPQAGAFVSEDPIGWSSGQANNYAYVGANPVSSVDPSGLKITVTGTNNYIDIVNQDLQNLASLDPRLNQLVDQLQNSSSNHTIENGGHPDTVYPRDAASDGTGAGSVTHYNPCDFHANGAAQNPLDVLAHELQHALDADRGNIDNSIDPITGNPRAEDRAMNTENIVRPIVGDPLRAPTYHPYVPK